MSSFDVGQLILMGIPGTELKPETVSLIQSIQPGGFIIFGRNIESSVQLRKLTDDLRSISKTEPFITIDQEGGRVSRLNKIFDFSYYTQKFFGNMYRKKKMFVFKNYYENYINFLCHIFNYLGININTSPVLDIERGKSNG